MEETMSRSDIEIPVQERTKVRAQETPKYKLQIDPNLSVQHLWIDNKREVVAIREGSKIRVFDSICPHMGAQLQYDDKKNCLYCPWHELDFSVRTCTSNHHKYKRVHEYTVELEKDVLKIYR